MRNITCLCPNTNEACFLAIVLSMISTSSLVYFQFPPYAIKGPAYAIKGIPYIFQVPFRVGGIHTQTQANILSEVCSSHMLDISILVLKLICVQLSLFFELLRTKKSKISQVCSKWFCKLLLTTDRNRCQVSGNSFKCFYPFCQIQNMGHRNIN